MVYDLYIGNKLEATYQSLNKANAGLRRKVKFVGSRYGNFVSARTPQPGKRAPVTLHPKSH